MIFFKREGNHDIPLPERNKMAAAFDMRARHDHVLGPREKVKMPLGFSVQPPESTCGMLLPRSGLGAKSDIILANTIGLIDPDYRGELIAVLFNRSNTTPFRISRGDRVCQLAIVPFCSMVAVEAEELSSTERGDSGFGDSGIK